MQCPICQSESSQALIKEGCAYLECPQCRFLFYRPERTGAENSVLGFYGRHYWEMERAEALRREREDGFIRALELLYLAAIPVENILDFGCGLGITVNMLREKLGINAVGVDLSADFEEAPHLHRCDLESLPAKYPDGFFDAIYSIEVFEHLENPNRTLELLGRLLKPGGKIMINTGTREFIEKYDPEQAYIDPLRRGHISIYSLESLSRIAESIGYSAEFLGDHRYAVILSPKGNQAPFPQSTNMERMLKLGEWFPAFLREYMRLVFMEKEFDKKSNWVSILLRQVEALEGERAQLIEELKSFREEAAAHLNRPVWKRIWKCLTEA